MSERFCARDLRAMEFEQLLRIAAFKKESAAFEECMVSRWAKHHYSNDRGRDQGRIRKMMEEEKLKMVDVVEAYWVPARAKQLARNGLDYQLPAALEWKVEEFLENDFQVIRDKLETRLSKMKMTLDVFLDLMDFRVQKALLEIGCLMIVA